MKEYFKANIWTTANKTSRSIKTRARRLSEMSIEAIKITNEFLKDFEDDYDDQAKATYRSKRNSQIHKEPFLKMTETCLLQNTCREELPPLFRDGNFVMVDGMILLNKANREKNRSILFGIGNLRSVFGKKKSQDGEKEDRMSCNLKGHSLTTIGRAKSVKF